MLDAKNLKKMHIDTFYKTILELVIDEFTVQVKRKEFVNIKEFKEDNGVIYCALQFNDKDKSLLASNITDLVDKVLWKEGTKDYPDTLFFQNNYIENKVKQVITHETIKLDILQFLIIDDYKNAEEIGKMISKELKIGMQIYYKTKAGKGIAYTFSNGKILAQQT